MVHTMTRLTCCNPSPPNPGSEAGPDRQYYRYADAVVRQDGIELGARASLPDVTGVDSTEKIG